MLAGLGHLLAELFRVHGIACRYGGEEFTVVLPEADLDAAFVQAERLRLAISDLVLQHDGEALPRVTASIGIAAIPGSVAFLHELKEAADRALYQAKSQGRNRVEASMPARP